ncbi:MAG: L-seryl-tRNA(Sec) selenium transferase [Thermoanaerobaculia bacterium]
MGKAPARAVDSAAGNLRSIPAVERILSSDAFSALVSAFGRDNVKRQLTAYLQSLRALRRPYVAAESVEKVAAALQSATQTTLRRVINGSGVIIHTNLGRSPVDEAIWRSAGKLVSGYSNLEFDLDAGERGSRDEHLSALAQTLFGAEAAVLTNNNAAGTLLLLAAVAADREVIVSRGELVEIGGGFRVPEVIQQGGAKLREVGTTNRTRARDYAEAVKKKRTAAILRVHRSNFDIVGFTETPSVPDLVKVAKKSRVPLLFDEGSGRVVDLAKYGFSSHETIRDLIAAGVDAVTCSTDKLIGATQGGLIIGRAAIIGKCRKHPLMRAVRAGKESYAVIAETLRMFAVGQHEAHVAIYGMLATSLDELRTRAREMVNGTKCRVIESRCALGGGTTPTETIPSIAIELPGNAEAIRKRMLHRDPPIVGRVSDDRFTIEVRTLAPGDLAPVAAALPR